MTQRNTPEALAWLKHQHDINSHAWGGLCLKLQRSARNLPGVFPSAFAAQMGTPMSDRVYDLNKLVSGMVVFIDDPHDSNRFGHIAGLRTRQKVDGDWLTWTNDALNEHGGVNCVDIDWFKANWGDSFQFGARSLNGFDLLLPKPVVTHKPSKHPEPPHKTATPDNFDYAIHRMQKARKFHVDHEHPRYVKAIDKAIHQLKLAKEGKV